MGGGGTSTKLKSPDRGATLSSLSLLACYLLLSFLAIVTVNYTESARHSVSRGCLPARAASRQESPEEAAASNMHA